MPNVIIETDTRREAKTGSALPGLLLAAVVAVIFPDSHLRLPGP